MIYIDEILEETVDDLQDYYIKIYGMSMEVEPTWGYEVCPYVVNIHRLFISNQYSHDVYDYNSVFFRHNNELNDHYWFVGL